LHRGKKKWELGMKGKIFASNACGQKLKKQGSKTDASKALPEFH